MCFSQDASRGGKMFLGGWNPKEGMVGGYIPVIILFGFRNPEAQGREAEVFLGKMDAWHGLMAGRLGWGRFAMVTEKLG